MGSCHNCAHQLRQTVLPCPPLLLMLPLGFLTLLSHTALSKEQAEFGPGDTGVRLLHSVPGPCRELGSIPAPSAGPWTRSAFFCPETSVPHHRGQSQGAGQGPQSCLRWDGSGVLSDCSVEENLGPSQFFTGADPHSVEPLRKIPPEPDMATPLPPWMDGVGRSTPVLPA